MRLSQTEHDELDRRANGGPIKLPPKQRLVPISWGRLNLLPKREPLIEGILDVGTMSVIVGTTGSYKTGLAIDWAGHIGTGVPWRGHKVRKGVALSLAPKEDAASPTGSMPQRRPCCHTAKTIVPAATDRS